jgi:hypothetical protein|tara:strand:+ start:861 stop:1781 length:921 start_codon:yes stop_codon:yes gene_type:complete
MIVKVSHDFRGELQLATIGYPVKRDNIIHLKDSDFFTDDVQLAVQKGWLKVEGEFPINVSPNLEKHRIKNTSSAPVSAANVAFEGNESKLLTIEQIQHPHMQAAINAGLLKVIEVVNLVVTPKKPTEVKDAPKQTKKKITKRAKKDEPETEELFRPTEPDTTMQAWDGRREEMLDKDESKRLHHREHKEVEITQSEDLGLQVGDIDFEQIDKEREQAAAQLEKLASKKKSRKKKTTKKTTKKKKANTLKAVGRQRPEAKAGDLDAFVDNNRLPNEVDFVDLEQIEERVSKHPKLKERLGDILELDQ